MGKRLYDIAIIRWQDAKTSEGAEAGEYESGQPVGMTNIGAVVALDSKRIVICYKEEEYSEHNKKYDLFTIPYPWLIQVTWLGKQIELDNHNWSVNRKLKGGGR